MSGTAESGGELLDEDAHEGAFLVDVIRVELADSEGSELGMLDELPDAFHGLGQSEPGVNGRKVSCGAFDEIHHVDVEMDQEPVDSVSEPAKRLPCGFGRVLLDF